MKQNILSNQHITFKQARKEISEHNEKNGITQQYQDKDRLYLVIVFSQSNWEKKYSLEERSYIVASDNKYFLPDMCGSSLYGNCLDGKDLGVRLDWYIHDWDIDYCYFSKKIEGIC